MALTDERNGCKVPAGQPSGKRTVPRQRIFCESIEIKSTLDVAGLTSLSSLLVFGHSKVSTLGAVAINSESVESKAVIVGEAIEPPPRGAGGAPTEATTIGSSSNTRAARAARAAGAQVKPEAATVNFGTGNGDVSIAGLLHVGTEFRLGSGNYVSFRTAEDAELVEYTLPPIAPFLDGQVLTCLQDGTMSWTSPGDVDPLTEVGDMLYRDTVNTSARLPIGTTGQYLVVSSEQVPEWKDIPNYIVDPTALQGDIVVRGPAGPARLPIGEVGQTLTVAPNGIDLTWQTPVLAGDNVSQFVNDANYVSEGDNVSELVNDAEYISNIEQEYLGDLLNVEVDEALENEVLTFDGTNWVNQLPAVQSVNGQTGEVALTADDITSDGTINQFATQEQLDAADSAVQPGDNISELNNDAGFLTTATLPPTSVNGQTGIIVLTSDDISDDDDLHKFVTEQQRDLIDTSIQPGDNVSELTNDANYITSEEAPVQSVAGRTGDVVLTKDDVGLDQVDNTSDLDKPISTATQTALDGKADLVNGTVPTSQLPSLAVTEYLGQVNSEAAMLQLTGERGDWVIRTDTGSTFILVNDGGSQASDWQEIATPADAVSSVNGYTGAVVLGPADVGAATAAQGATADSAIQPGDNVSELVNDANYITAGEAPVQTVNGQNGTVVLDADDIDDTNTLHKFATQAQLDLADTSVQPGDNVSDLVNDANYITAAEAPVQTVNGQDGTVVLDADDINDDTTLHKFATQTELDLANSSVQPGDNVSDLTNDAGYISNINGERLDDLLDVIVPTPTAGEILQYDGTNWVSGSILDAGSF